MTPDKRHDPLHPVQTINPDGTSSVVLVCEHAAHDIPARFNNLGMTSDVGQSHAAWDPGALAVATHLSQKLDAALVAGRVSRLVYDCNRPPEAPDAMPARSEVFDIPGNMNLSPEDRAARVRDIYEPFRDAVATQVAKTANPVVVTIHSFTPVYHGQTRPVEIGVLHDADTRLADAMMDIAARHTTADVRRNEPYGPQHGVTHTLKVHALAHGHMNVMLEVRNDLIVTDAEQRQMAGVIADWVTDAFARTNVAGDVQCLA